MAYITINPATLPGGYQMWTDLVGSVNVTGHKILLGAAGADGGYVSAANPLPVSVAALPLPSGASTEATLLALLALLDDALPRDVVDRAARLLGHVVVDSSALPAGAALDATVQAVRDRLPAALIGGKLSVVGPATDAELRASPLPVSAASLPLPAGAAQEHVAANSPNAVRLTDGAAFYKATTPAETQPISAASLPLPAGAATSARQDTGNASLASVDGKLPALVSGRVPVDGSGVTQPVSGPLTDAQLRASRVAVDAGLQLDAFANLIVGYRNNQVEADFHTGNPDTIVTVTKTSTGSSANTDGSAVFSRGANVNGTVSAVSAPVVYRPLHEIYAAFTASFTTGGAAAPGLTHRRGGVDQPRVAQASFSEDTLTGQAGSRFTRDGVPEAIDWAKDNIFIIAFGWLGGAPIRFSVLSPDGAWVVFHKINWPNTNSGPSILNPELPIRFEVADAIQRAGIFDASDGFFLGLEGAPASAASVKTGCWALGTTAQTGALSETITTKSLAMLTRSVIVAQKPNGDFAQVTSNANGRLLVSNDSVGATGSASPTQATMVGGSDGTNLRALSTDAAGRLTTREDNAFSSLIHLVALPTEEARVREDQLADPANPHRYHARAPAGTATASAAWEAVRFFRDATGVVRVQYRTGVAFDSITAGW